MADCSKAVEFSRELNRLCEMEDCTCVGTCPFNDDGRQVCPYGREITQEDVDIVQKWSDEHPIPKPKTYADDFFEKFPKAKNIDGRPVFCRSGFYGTPCRVVDSDVIDSYGNDCLSCWNEVMPE